MPIDVTNVLLVCPHCDKPTRAGKTWTQDGDGRAKMRRCRKCKKEIR